MASYYPGHRQRLHADREQEAGARAGGGHGLLPADPGPASRPPSCPGPATRPPGAPEAAAGGHEASGQHRPGHAAPGAATLSHTKVLAGHCVQARSKLQPVWAQQPQESLQEEAATRDQDQDVERCGVVMLPALLTTCCRFIAVPISATEQYLISSSGQTYLTEKLPSPVPGAPCPLPALTVTMIMFTASIHDIPSGERLPPLGMASNMTFIM